MLIKNKKVILHEPVISQVSAKTGKNILVLLVRDPDDGECNTVYSYNEKYRDLKAGVELTLNLHLVKGNLITVEGK